MLFLPTPQSINDEDNTDDCNRRSEGIATEEEEEEVGDEDEEMGIEILAVSVTDDVVAKVADAAGGGILSVEEKEAGTITVSGLGAAKLTCPDPGGVVFIIGELV